MTQPPQEPRPSIYTRLDGKPLPPPEVAAPQIPGAGAWGQQPLAAVPAGHQYVLATWGSRFGAYLIDAFLFGLLAWAVMVPVGVALGLTVSEAAEFFGRISPLPESIAEPTPFYVAFAIQLLIPGIALALALLRMGGQSPGKRALGIQVVRADGRPLDSQTAFRREVAVKVVLLSLVALVTFGLGWLLNYLWPLWDRQHRAGHDAIVGTRVVQTPKKR
jgi:uncharacterized RDD family membrane protein YckC